MSERNCQLSLEERRNNPGCTNSDLQDRSTGHYETATCDNCPWYGTLSEVLGRQDTDRR